MMDYRIEKDTIGEMKVPADKYWGLKPNGARRTSLSGREDAP
ncbi:hypothetical protein ACPJHQ_09225 [Rossellomorea sp. H39__3]